MLMAQTGISVGIDINKDGIDFARGAVKKLEERGIFRYCTLSIILAPNVSGVYLPNVAFEKRNVFLRDLKDRRWYCTLSRVYTIFYTIGIEFTAAPVVPTKLNIFCTRCSILVG